jgi:hypothetical protein
MPQDCILGHSQPSLRDWLFASPKPRTDVLGYSQPSLTGLNLEIVVLSQTC